MLKNGHTDTHKHIHIFPIRHSVRIHSHLHLLIIFHFLYTSCTKILKVYIVLYAFKNINITKYSKGSVKKNKKHFRGKIHEVS